jgi:hypothetical protein
MRFRGGGVGHKSTREASNFFKNDRDQLDVPGTATQPYEQEDAEMEGDPEEPIDEVDEDEEQDFGYVREESDVSEGELAVDDEDVDFGPEDDGALDPDQDITSELGYGNL